MSKFVDAMIDFILADDTPVTPAEQPDVAAFDAAIAAGEKRLAAIASHMADLDMTRAEAEEMQAVVELYDGTHWQRRRAESMLAERQAEYRRREQREIDPETDAVLAGIRL